MNKNKKMLEDNPEKTEKMMHCTLCKVKPLRLKDVNLSDEVQII